MQLSQVGQVRTDMAGSAFGLKAGRVLSLQKKMIEVPTYVLQNILSEVNLNICARQYTYKI